MSNDIRLFDPGKYELSFNQEYLIAKLHKIDFYSNIFSAFWISIFASLAVYACYKAIKKTNLLEKEAEERNKEKEAQDLFYRFHELCRLIYEDRNVFRRPEKMINQMYYPEMKDLVIEMSKYQNKMRKEHRHLIPDYEYYKDIVMKEKQC